MISLGIEKNETTVVQMLEYLDTDEDNLISRNEFIKFIKDTPEIVEGNEECPDDMCKEWSFIWLHAHFYGYKLKINYYLHFHDAR